MRDQEGNKEKNVWFDKELESIRQFHEGPLKRCFQCGRLVFHPCHACETTRKSRVCDPLDVDLVDWDELCIDLRHEERQRYEQFHAQKVLNETSILLPNGNLVRPDRIVFLEGRVVVIDYKTGEPHASHKEQIDQYCEAIRAMGYGEVEGRILYV